MKQLKVTWQDGGWNRDGDQPIASAIVPAYAAVVALGEETLVFKHGTQGTVYLVIPSSRLISAVEVEEENVNG